MVRIEILESHCPVGSACDAEYATSTFRIVESSLKGNITVEELQELLHGWDFDCVLQELYQIKGSEYQGGRLLFIDEYPPVDKQFIELGTDVIQEIVRLQIPTSDSLGVYPNDECEPWGEREDHSDDETETNVLYEAHVAFHSGKERSNNPYSDRELNQYWDDGWSDAEVNFYSDCMKAIENADSPIFRAAIIADISPSEQNKNCARVTFRPFACEGGEFAEWFIRGYSCESNARYIQAQEGDRVKHSIELNANSVDVKPNTSVIITAKQAFDNWLERAIEQSITE